MRWIGGRGDVYFFAYAHHPQMRGKREEIKGKKLIIKKGKKEAVEKIDKL